MVASVVIAACFGEAKLATSRQAVIVPDRDPVEMGSVVVGQMVTTSPAITLSPETETSDDTITSITESCADFALSLPNGGSGQVFCSGGPIGSGSAPTFALGGAGYGTGACVPVTYSFNATFMPSGPGSASCAVTVNYTPTGGGSGSSRLITLNGTGTAPAFALTVTPPTISFSDHPIGSTSSATTVAVKNTGSMVLTVTGTNSNPSNFSVAPVGAANFGSQSLTSGQQVGFSVRCTPIALGPITGVLTFDSAAGPRTVTLSCNGIGASNLAITPVPGDFGPTLVGRAPANLSIQITNSGTAATTLSVALAAGASPELAIVTNPNGMNLPMGMPTNVVLSYSALTDHPSGSLGTLVVNYTGGTARNIAINGTALPAEIGAAPAAIDFGPICVGETATKPVMVYASAAGNVDIATVTGAAPPFGVTRTTGTLQGNHGNTIDFMATVSPTAPGELMDSFTLNTNLPNNPARSFPLKATALPAGVTPTPDLVHFGPGRVGMTTSAKTIEVSNCGNAPINITAARIEGTSANDFAIVSPENPVMSLPQMGSVKFLVVMSPRQSGTKAAQLVIEYDGGTVIADLDGNGFGGDETALLDRETYYACSTGSGGGLAPLALALGLLLRRRRRA